MLGLIHNELLVIAGRWRSYIGFIGISILMPLILWGFSVGGEELHRDYARELGGTFMVVGSILNSFLATYIIMNTLWIHIPFLVTLAAGDSVAADGANGIFRITLTRSVSRFKILVSKLMASYIYTALLLIFCAFWSLGIGSIVLGTGDLIVIDNGILILDESQAWVRMAFSFLLAIPVIAGAGLLTALDTQQGSISIPRLQLLLAFFSAFIVGTISLKWLLGLLESGKFHRFGYYCIMVGLITYLAI